jgi:ribosome-associated heat shock protein Hsp15
VTVEDDRSDDATAPDPAATAAAPPAPEPAGPGQRIDKWLFHARFFKTRSLAGKLAAAGKIRVDGRIVGKAHFAVRPGHVLTFVQGRHVRVVRVVRLPERRGPAAEAQACYDDLQPPTPQTALPRTDGPTVTKGPAPTKRERREAAKLRGR